MRKFTVLTGLGILTGLLTLVSPIKAQITINQSDLPTAGLTVVTDSDGTTKPSPGSPSMSSQSWDFSGLQKQKSYTTNFITVGSTPYASTFSAANLADTTLGKDGYNYFSSQSTLFAVEGAEENEYVAAASTNFKIEINLSPMFEQAPLPATYNTTIPQSVASGSQTFSVTFSVVVTGERFNTNIFYSDTVDAWGTMKMPNHHTYPVLREKHNEVDYDSVFLYNTLSNSWAYYERIVTYKNQYDWYANGVGYILAEMDMDSVWSNQKDVIWDTTAPAPLGINEISASGRTNIYPNPCSPQLNLMTTDNSAQYLITYDVAGRELNRIEIKNGAGILNTSMYSNGVYFYTLTDKSGTIVDRGKFTVQK